MYNLRLSPSGPFRPVGLPDLWIEEPLPDEDFPLTSVRHRRVIYTLDAKDVTGSRRDYSPVDGEGADDGDQIVLQIDGELGTEITAGAATVPVGGTTNTRQFLQWMRIDGEWVLIMGAVTETSAVTPSQRNREDLSGSPDGVVDLGFVEFVLDQDNQAFDWQLYLFVTITTSTDYRRRVVIQPSGGGPTLETVFDEIGGGAGITEWDGPMRAETTKIGRHATSLPAGTYRLQCSAENGAGVPAPTTGNIAVITPVT